MASYFGVTREHYWILFAVTISLTIVIPRKFAVPSSMHQQSYIASCSEGRFEKWCLKEQLPLIESKVSFAVLQSGIPCFSKVLSCRSLLCCQSNFLVLPASRIRVPKNFRDCPAYSYVTFHCARLSPKMVGFFSSAPTVSVYFQQNLSLFVHLWREGSISWPRFVDLAHLLFLFANLKFVI